MEIKEIYYPRALEEKIAKYLHRREIVCARGSRQVGKTTILKHLIKDNKAVYLTMDDWKQRTAFESDPVGFVRRYLNELKNENEARAYLLLDEIQKAKNAGEGLKLIYDSDEFKNLKLFISSSSSLALDSQILPQLVGRAFVYDLFSFDFGEYLRAKDAGLAKLHSERNEELRKFLNGEAEIIRLPLFEQEFLKHWKEYAIFGGYPEVVKNTSEEEKILVLQNIFNLYVGKDIVEQFGIEKARDLTKFLKVLAFNISSLFRSESVKNELKISHRDAETYLNVLQATHIISLVLPFYKNLTTELKKNPKLYFLDLGIRNAVLNNFSPFDNRSDRGTLSENFVFRQLVSSYDFKINFWRTTGKAEVDFILTKGDKVIPVEVKLTKGNLGKSFHSFLDAYNPKRALVVTLNEFGQKKVKNTIVYFVPIYYF